MVLGEETFMALDRSGEELCSTCALAPADRVAAPVLALPDRPAPEVGEKRHAA